MSALTPQAHGPATDWARVRGDFPLLQRQVHGKSLVYLDSANTSQKPRQVIEAVDDFYRAHNANISRAVHTLGMEATGAYEAARATIGAFIGAPEREIVFTRNSTEGINLVAYALSNAATAKEPEFRRYAVGQGDEIVVTEMEHHACLRQRDAARAQVEQRLLVQPANGGAVRRLHLVGVDLQHRLRVDFRVG